ncbi:glycosyltransferase family 2 protein [Gordoniibacillus kamchatkensis]|uniref:glycosyltransferase family 2 protein n=1 Tax=Gordoniibacillus kamchatkensis TaxID=1590651 RepID=UPI000A5B910C|nr:glycosyltransferase family 2 protein [Paenibacillus sp. VKM B-2647]
MASEPPVLMIVIPCYNEEEVLSSTIATLSDEVARLEAEGLVARRSGLLFVDDGSRDSTWQQLEQHAKVNRRVSALKLARNAGHQNALLCGLLRAKELADCVVSIDADLQDDIAVIREFVLRFREGCDVVYGIRRSRAADSRFKRLTAVGFYRTMARLGVQLEHNHADCRLLSRRALQQLEQFREVNLFLRGLVPMLGLPSGRVYYDRKPRLAGESKYPLRRMLGFAMEGITSLSIRPIRFVAALGFALSAASFAAALYTLASKWLGLAISGWSSLMLSVWLLGGMQLLALGLIGEYVGKIYLEVKKRPRFLIETELLSADTALQPEDGAALVPAILPEANIS